MISLYLALRDYPGDAPWREVILPAWSTLTDNRDFLRELQVRPCAAWPEIDVEELWTLYAMSRVSDLLLLRFQRDLPGQMGYAGPNVTLEQYCELFQHLGFVQRPVHRFHPFDCEIVEVQPSPDGEVAVTKVLWPAMMLGNMLFSRAGVVLQAPTDFCARDLVTTSTLYWAHLRKRRRTADLSVGWGSSSQWRTPLRRDFDLGDHYAYNVDRCNEAIDLRTSVPAHDEDDPVSWLEAPDRIDLLRFRCLTKLWVSHDFWVYDDYFAEPQSGPIFYSQRTADSAPVQLMPNTEQDFPFEAPPDAVA